jgi:lipoate-protein ligase B
VSRRPAWIARPGLLAFSDANEAMHALAERRLHGNVTDGVIIVQHPPVFTGGRRSKAGELLWSEAEVRARGGEVHRIDRGGAFTFHGPGQLVAYPILDLGTRPDAGAYLRDLEEVVIRSAADVGVGLHRRDDVQTGVWAGDDKVCAIGIRLMRARITLHGFALNCDTDLSWFDGIVACGLESHGVTSLTRLAGRAIGVDEMLPTVEHHLGAVFGLDFVSTPDDIGTLVAGAASHVA